MIDPRSAQPGSYHTSGHGAETEGQTQVTALSGRASARPGRPGAASPAGWSPPPAGEAAPPVRPRGPARSDGNSGIPEARWLSLTRLGPRHIPVVGPTEALHGRPGGPGMAAPRGAATGPHGHQRRSGWQLAHQAWQDAGVEWETVPASNRPDPHEPHRYEPDPYAPGLPGSYERNLPEPTAYGPNPYQPGPYEPDPAEPDPAEPDPADPTWPSPSRTSPRRTGSWWAGPRTSSSLTTGRWPAPPATGPTRGRPGPVLRRRTARGRCVRDGRSSGRHARDPARPACRPGTCRLPFRHRAMAGPAASGRDAATAGPRRPAGGSRRASGGARPVRVMAARARATLLPAAASGRAAEHGHPVKRVRRARRVRRAARVRIAPAERAARRPG